MSERVFHFNYCRIHLISNKDPFPCENTLLAYNVELSADEFVVLLILWKLKNENIALVRQCPCCKSYHNLMYKTRY